MAGYTSGCQHEHPVAAENVRMRHCEPGGGGALLILRSSSFLKTCPVFRKAEEAVLSCLYLTLFSDKLCRHHPPGLLSIFTLEGLVGSNELLWCGSVSSLPRGLGSALCSKFLHLQDSKFCQIFLHFPQLAFVSQMLDSRLKMPSQCSLLSISLLVIIDLGRLKIWIQTTSVEPIVHYRTDFHTELKNLVSSKLLCMLICISKRNYWALILLITWPTHL